MWAFGISNVIVFLLILTLAAIAFKTYERERMVPFLIASIGFLILAFGSILEGIYEFGVNEGYQTFGEELYLLRTAEATLLALGVVLLLISLKRV